MENNGSGTIAYTTDVAAGIGEQEQEYKANLFPNPVSHVAKLSLETAEVLERSTLSVLDAQGRALKTIVFDGSSVEIDASELASGLYFYTVRTAAGRTLSGKMIVNN